MRLHLHLISDSTGETLESVAKASVVQFEQVEFIKHYWPMVRSEGHLDRVLDEIEKRPGLILFTLVNGAIRERLESCCAQRQLTAIAVLDPVVMGLSAMLGQRAANRPGRQHIMDAAYFARVDAIAYTLAHDDGQGSEQWEEADIILAGVSRSSKTPTSIYLSNRGYKVANVPIVPESPPPSNFYTLQKPLIVGLTTNSERLIQVRRNRMLSMGQAPETAYVDPEQVSAEIAYARRIFADHGWPVIDVSRRSIEETAAAILNLMQARQDAENGK